MLIGNFLNIRYASFVIFICVTVLFSCKKGATGYINMDIEGSINAPTEGGEISIGFDSNLDDWTVRFEYGGWLSARYLDNKLIVTAEKNENTSERMTTMIVTSIKNPEEIKRINIIQQAVKITASNNGLVQLASTDGEANTSVTTNLKTWKYSIVTGANWFRADTVAGNIIINAVANPNLFPRTGSILITSETFPNLKYTITVAQLGTDPNIESVILSENWNWLPSVNSQPLPTIIYQTTNELPMHNWTDKRGWNAVTSPTNIRIYSRNGYIKTGTASITQDLITPKLNAVNTGDKLLVQFNAHAFMDFNGTSFDNNEMNVSIIGNGQITEIRKIGGQKGTPAGMAQSSGVLTSSGARFKIGNYNNPDGPTRQNWLGDTYNQWDTQYAERSFVITGANADTQVVFHFGSLPIGTVTKGNRLGFGSINIYSIIN